ncbi:MAG: hypothetical protein ACK5N0_03570 [Synechococcaceae cyanobacterium]
MDGPYSHTLGFSDLEVLVKEGWLPSSLAISPVDGGAVETIEAQKCSQSTTDWEDTMSAFL